MVRSVFGGRILARANAPTRSRLECGSKPKAPKLALQYYLGAWRTVVSHFSIKRRRSALAPNLTKS
jgi:hypothetical protein